MSNLVIVALPAKDDYINKISSEEVPHLTLLFLGDDSSKVKNLSRILDFTRHAAEQSLTRFGLEVDRRGELGENKADVLFFSKSRWSGFEIVRDYRSYLLQDNNIRTAYDSAKDQYPEWVPHLTLGYPETPAKPDNRDYPGISYISFDRIAVWFGEHEGIEFPLRTREWDLDVAMSTDTGKEIVGDILEHHGTKGMQWGKRKQYMGPAPRGAKAKGFDGRKLDDKVASTARRIVKGKDASPSRREIRRDKKFAKAGNSLKVKIALNNASAGAMTSTHCPRINAKPIYKKAASNGTLLNPNHPTTKKYHEEMMTAYVKEMNKHTVAVGSQKYVATRNPKDLLGFTVTTINVKHDDTSAFKVKFVKNSKGEITGFEFDGDSIEQSSTLVDDILKHYGAKGMRWGVRKNSAGPQAVTVKDKRKKLKTSGGHGQPAHDDAVKAHTVGQIGKKSGTKSLSNAQLKTYNERLNLEQNFKRLQYQDSSRGKKFVKTALNKKGGPEVETAKSVGKLAMKSTYVRKKIAIGASVVALA